MVTGLNIELRFPRLVSSIIWKMEIHSIRNTKPLLYTRGKVLESPSFEGYSGCISKVFQFSQSITPMFLRVFFLSKTNFLQQLF